MTIQNLIDTLQEYVARVPEAKDDVVLIDTPNGTEELAGADFAFEPTPGIGRPVLALVIATEPEDDDFPDADTDPVQAMLKRQSEES